MRILTRARIIAEIRERAANLESLDDDALAQMWQTIVGDTAEIGAFERITWNDLGFVARPSAEPVF